MENISLLLFTRLLKLFGDNNFTIKDIYKDVNFYEKNTVYTEDVKENINIALNYLIDNEYILKTNNESFKINKFQKQQFEQLAYFEPYYLKDFMLTVKK